MNGETFCVFPVTKRAKFECLRSGVVDDDDTAVSGDFYWVKLGSCSPRVSSAFAIDTIGREVYAHRYVSGWNFLFVQ